MKIALVMWYNDKIKEYADVNYKINYEYCKKFGYDFIKSDERLTNHVWLERFFLIKKNIDKYDYIIWIDADAHFIYPFIPITKIIKRNLDKHFIFSEDMKHYSTLRDNNIPNLNVGIFIIKNTDYSKELLNNWIDYAIKIKDNGEEKKGFEQDAIAILIKKNYKNLKNMSIILPFGILQRFSYKKINKNKKIIVKYPILLFKYKLTHPFICHHAGESYDTRVKLSKKYYDKLLKILDK